MITDFHAWPQPTLADFAAASHARMLEQDARIKTLENNLLVVVDSYLLLMAQTAPSQAPIQ